MEDKIRLDNKELISYLITTLVANRATTTALVTLLLELYQETSSVDRRQLIQRLNELAEQHSGRLYEEIVGRFGELPPDILELLNPKK